LHVRQIPDSLILDPKPKRQPDDESESEQRHRREAEQNITRATIAAVWAATIASTAPPLCIIPAKHL